MHVQKGDRVYLLDTLCFGNVNRTKILGVSSGVSITVDNGELHVFTGDRLKGNIVNVETGKDGYDVDIDIPSDVRLIGQEVLTGLGIDPISQLSLFQKFMALSNEERLESSSQWDLISSDPENRDVYIQNIMDTLEDDTVFIQKQSAKLLSHLSDEMKGYMLTRMFQITTVEDRKNFIVQFYSIQNDKKKTELFVQALYEILLDNSDYLRVEFERFGKKFHTPEQLSNKIDSFLSGTTESEKEDIISNWRDHHKFISSTAPLFVRNVLSKY